MEQLPGWLTIETALRYELRVGPSEIKQKQRCAIGVQSPDHVASDCVVAAAFPGGLLCGN